MNDQALIQNPCLKIRIGSIVPQHPENILGRRQRLARIPDNQGTVIVVMLVRMIIVNGNHRHDTDQVQRLPENILDRRIVRILVIGIQCQDRPLHAVHDVLARRLQYDITHKLGRQLPVL